ncbi:MAG: low molecular weight phosphotyrosine protein phosphatase [Clostridia bacterium]|nr:low molecular weight phosphotyrosine protein phosphatase [Clostridia bacterium]
MIRVTFVCLGNICRSPMAELLFKNMVKERGLASSFEITSGGTFDYEEGSPFYSPAKETLRAHGVEGEHTARKITMDDVAKSDYLLVMDENNYRDLTEFAGDAGKGKIFMLLSFASRGGAVADPWYTRDFEKEYSDIEEGCRCFLDFIINSKERSER